MNYLTLKLIITCILPAFLVESANITQETPLRAPLNVTYRTSPTIEHLDQSGVPEAEPENVDTSTNKDITNDSEELSTSTSPDSDPEAESEPYPEEEPDRETLKLSTKDTSNNVHAGTNPTTSSDSAAEPESETSSQTDSNTILDVVDNTDDSPEVNPENGDETNEIDDSEEDLDKPSILTSGVANQSSKAVGFSTHSLKAQYCSFILLAAAVAKYLV